MAWEWAWGSVLEWVSASELAWGLDWGSERASESAKAPEWAPEWASGSVRVPASESVPESAWVSASATESV